MDKTSMDSQLNQTNSSTLKYFFCYLSRYAFVLNNVVRCWLRKKTFLSWFYYEHEVEKTPHVWCCDVHWCVTHFVLSDVDFMVSTLKKSEIFHDKQIRNSTWAGFECNTSEMPSMLIMNFMQIFRRSKSRKKIASEIFKINWKNVDCWLISIIQ